MSMNYFRIQLHSKSLPTHLPPNEVNEDWFIVPFPDLIVAYYQNSKSVIHHSQGRPDLWMKSYPWHGNWLLLYNTGNCHTICLLQISRPAYAQLVKPVSCIRRFQYTAVMKFVNGGKLSANYLGLNPCSNLQFLTSRYIKRSLWSGQIILTCIHGNQIRIS